MRIWTTALGLGAALVLAACGSDNGSPAEAQDTSVSLCVASDCGELLTLAAVPDAENLLFTPDGRLFVSGGTNVFEVVRDGETALLCPPGDTGAYATALRRLATDPEMRTRIGSAGRDLLEAEYTWEERARRVLDGIIEVGDQ